MNTVYIVSLEPIETRYTVDWFEFIPQRVSKYILENNLPYQVKNIGSFRDGINSDTSEGAFLNFADTNIWKNDQLNYIASLFSTGMIVPGDKFIFTDAWNPGIIQLRYMSSLLDVHVEIHSIWHAGSYDPWDFLGRKFDKGWSYYFEKSLFSAADKNYFATGYHADLFRRTLGFMYEDFIEKGCVCGFPFDYLKEKIKYDGRKKRNLILFPHRISEEKQLDIFKDLSNHFQNYEFVICQEKRLSKNEYYDLLLAAKIVFSANLQETLGISMYEGYLANAIPIVPDRLSYSEIYTDDCKYPSEWTEYSTANIDQRKDEMIDLIDRTIRNYDSINFKIQTDLNLKNNLKLYFEMDKMLTFIFNDN